MSRIRYTPLERIASSRYSSMKSRCYNYKCIAFINYGARGVTICDDWLLNKQAFIKWFIENCPDPSYSIERLNVWKGYSPENCTFIPITEQNWNKRNSRDVYWKDKWHTLSRIYNEYPHPKVPYSLFVKRIKHNWRVEHAISSG